MRTSGATGTAGSPVAGGLIDAVPDGLVVADAAGTIRFVNRRLAELVGRPRSDLVGRPVEELVPDDLARSHIELRQEHGATGRPDLPMVRGARTRIRSSDGAVIPVDLTVAFEDAADERLVVISIRDARDRLRSEGATAGSRRRLTELYEAVPLAILGLGIDGTITYANPHLCHLVGVGAEQVVGSEGLRMLLGMNHPANPDDEYAEIIRQGRSTYHEGWLRGAEGRRRVVGWHTVPVHGDGGEDIGTLSIGEDLTARRRSEDALGAIREVGTAVLRGESTARVEQLVCDAARKLVDASHAVLARPGPLGCEVKAASGSNAGTLRGLPATAPWCSRGSSEPAVIVHRSFDGFEEQAGISFGPTMMAPLAEPPSCGFLLVADDPGASPFDDDAIESIRAFAGQANVVLEYGNRLRELAVVEDRERIARDLHDLVIQRIFAAGLTLQITSQMVEDRPAVASRLGDVAESLDMAISELRRSILGLEDREAKGARPTIERAVSDVTAGTGLQVDIDVPDGVGPIPDVLLRNLVAVLREALSNALRHASAGRVRVTVEAGSALVLTVEDDGVGLDPSLVDGGHGLSNLASRAASLGGALHLLPGEMGGLLLVWRVPLGAFRTAEPAAADVG